MNEVMKYINSDSIADDACSIIDSARRVAYKSVNVTLVLRNWLLGRRICEEELYGSDRAEYGAEVIKNLSEFLTSCYGKGFNKRTVYKFQQFYKYFPDIVRSVTAQSEEGVIVPSVTAQSLSWSHYEKLLQVADKEAREWYAKEAYEQTWSVKTLQRNIHMRHRIGQVRYYIRFKLLQGNIKIRKYRSRKAELRKLFFVSIIEKKLKVLRSTSEQI